MAEFKAPLVVGVRQIQPSHEPLSLEKAMLDIGQNTGNIMFTESLIRNVKNATWGSFALRESDLDGHDAIVLAAANWINSYDDFSWLAERLERTKLPVFLVGVGAQSSFDHEVPVIKDGTKRLLDIVNDRSAGISARGVFSCEVLAKYGIKSAKPTGCPSLLLAGAEGPSIRSPADIEVPAPCLHSTRHLFQDADAMQRYLYAQGLGLDVDLILQSEIADMYAASSELRGRANEDEAIGILRKNYGTEDFAQIERYLKLKSHVFFNYDMWIAYMKTMTFCLGTRIHGTVASLVAGTAATLIVHDSRTLEMAEAMSIPFVRSSEVDLNGPLSLEAYHRPDQIDRFAKNYPEYRKNFSRFFTECGLALCGDAK